MKAMVFAAGIGSRFGERTKETPKSLVPLLGRPLIEHVLERLKEAGVTDVMVNLFHLPDKVRAHFERSPYPGMKVHFAEEHELLGTGGGLKNVREFFSGEEVFFVHNCDIWSTVSLRKLAEAHLAEGSLATLCVQQRPSTRGLLFTPDLHLGGWNNGTSIDIALRERERELSYWPFCGIHAVSGSFLHYLEPFSGNFSIIEGYLQAVRSGAAVRGLPVNDALWFDIGTEEKLEHCEEALRSRGY